MKKSFLLLIASATFCAEGASAASLLQVYNEAVVSDPIYQQAIAQQLVTREGVPISLASLLPAAAIQFQPSVSRETSSGATIQPSSLINHAYQLGLTLNQTIFDFGKFANLAGARYLSKQADATFNAATQDLIVRVATAYFNVLKDEDNLAYNAAYKKALREELDQIREQYKVGLKTITDLYTAQASYDTASANYIAAETTLADDKENLRVITGNTYPNLSMLSEKFPLITPSPADMEAWVKSAIVQNWGVRAAQYANQNAMANIRQQFAGNLPTLNTQGSYAINYTKDSNGSLEIPVGSSKTRDLSLALTLNVPLFSGGGVVAATQQARYNYQLTSQQLEQTLRNTANNTRQSYMGINAGIRKIQADKQAIKSTISSLNGLREGYRVGTQTLVDVLDQQQKVFEAETTYATDRYQYVINLLTLKQAAGTLGREDVLALEAWLA